MKTLVKPSGLIHISHSFSRMQYTLFNLLLANAYEKLNRGEYKILLSDLKKGIGKTHDDKYIKESILGLRREIKCNLLGKDKRKWGELLLKEVKFEKGVCTYSFDEALCKLLGEPDMYSRVDLEIERNFKSKYALFLYELCNDYVGIRQTPWIEVQKLRELLGITGYENFRELKRVIIKAVEEVNKVSNLSLEIDYDKFGRTVERVKFKVRKSFRKDVIPARVSDYDEELIKRLEECGVPRREGTKFVLKYEYWKIVRAIKIYKQSKTKKDNPVGWFFCALEKGWKFKKYEPKVLKEGPLFERLVGFGIRKGMAAWIVRKYPEKYILEKIAAMERSKVEISNKAGWLIKALWENWVENNAVRLAQQKIEKRKKREEFDKSIKRIEENFNEIIEKKAYMRYEVLSEEDRKSVV